MLVLVLCVAGCGRVGYEPGTEPLPTTSRIGPGTRIPIGGRDVFLLGASLPWVEWGSDFGDADRGIGNTSNRDIATAAMTSVTPAGARVVRWVIFGNVGGVARAPDGSPAASQPQVLADLDTALAIARESGAYLVLTLFAGDPVNFDYGWMQPEQRASLVELVRTIVSHAAGDERVIAWQVFEWLDAGIAELPVDLFREATPELVRAIRAADPGTWVALGAVNGSQLGMLTGLGADFYTTIEPGAGPGAALTTSYDARRAEQGLDGPLVVSLFYVAAGTDGADHLEEYYVRGYAGAWPWSLTARTDDGRTVDPAALSEFAARIDDEGP